MKKSCECKSSCGSSKVSEVLMVVLFLAAIAAMGLGIEAFLSMVLK